MEEKKAEVVKTEKYGGFWIRLLAYIIDAVLLNIVFSILSAPLKFMQLNMDYNTVAPDPAQVTALMLGSLGYMGVVVIATFLYMTLMESSKYQGTIGKIVLSLKVVDDQGKRISFGRAVGRYFSKILSSLILGIGYLMIGFDSKKQGLHDKIANTYVVKK